MGFFIFLSIIILLIVILSLISSNKRTLLEQFKRCNVIVGGKIGTGKDLIFQYVIAYRKKQYFANIDYGYNYNHIDFKDLEISPNTYDSFIKGEVQKIDQKYNLENIDIYISDCGVFLPSQYDTKLHKEYPSLPITYALTRHLYNNHIHVNVQNLNRLWKALREQADSYIICQKTINIFNRWFIVKYIIYDKYETALNNIQPLDLRTKLFHKDIQVTEKAKFKALYGEIKKGFIIVPRKIIHYDTRAFKNIIFKEELNKLQNNVD